MVDVDKVWGGRWTNWRKKNKQKLLAEVFNIADFKPAEPVYL